MRRPNRARGPAHPPASGADGSNDPEAAIAGLAQLPVAGLRAEWRRLYRTEPPKKLRRDTLQLAVAWKLQAHALGGLSTAATRSWPN